ncbi:hypothetical protein Tco_1241580 [Tanacetum coccineum]
MPPRISSATARAAATAVARAVAASAAATPMTAAAVEQLIEARAVAQDVACAMDWKTLKKMMTVKYYPRGEIKKLEIELWNLKKTGHLARDSRSSGPNGNNNNRGNSGMTQNAGTCYECAGTDAEPLE